MRQASNKNGRLRDRPSTHYAHSETAPHRRPVASSRRASILLARCLRRLRAGHVRSAPPPAAVGTIEAITWAKPIARPPPAHASRTTTIVAAAPYTAADIGHLRDQRGVFDCGKQTGRRRQRHGLRAI